MNPFTDLLTAFLQGDDRETAALVLADWLDEHDQPDYARYLRLMVMCHQRPDAVSVDDWRDEMDRLQAMRGPFRPREWPLRSRVFVGQGQYDTQISDWSQTAEAKRLERIELRGANPPYRDSWQDWRWILDADRFPRLREVHLSHFAGMFDDSETDYGRVLRVNGIESLSILHVYLSEEQGDDLIRHGFDLVQPRSLSIVDDETGSELLIEDLEGKPGERLQSLRFGGRALNDAALEHLIRTANLPALRHLDLTGGDYSPQLIESLVEAPFAQSLHELRIGSNRPAPRGQWRFALDAISRRLPRLQRLTLLGLTRTDVEPALHHSDQSWPELRQLTIDSSVVPRRRVRDFLRSFQPPKLWSVSVEPDTAAASIKLPGGWRYDGGTRFFREDTPL